MTTVIRNVKEFGYALLIISFAALSGCSNQNEQQAQQAMETESASGMNFTRAVAVLHPTKGNTASGVVIFTQMENSVKVAADLTGLPAGDHGFHIHENGDCSALDGTSAGGHFNPLEMPHAGPDAEKRHVGDLGNITADEAGNAHYERVDSHLSLNGPNGIIGRGVIVHAGTDDLTSQPTGAAGARVACGVIGIAE